MIPLENHPSFCYVEIQCRQSIGVGLKGIVATQRYIARECAQQIPIYYLPMVMLNAQPNFDDLVRNFHPCQPEG